MYSLYCKYNHFFFFSVSIMASYETGYQALGSFPEEENDDEASPAIHILPEGGTSKYNLSKLIKNIVTFSLNFHIILLLFLLSNSEINPHFLSYHCMNRNSAMQKMDYTRVSQKFCNILVTLCTI